MNPLPDPQPEDDLVPPDGPHIRIDAAVLGFLLPGLGHMRLGQVRRGRLIMFGVLFLFLSGVLIGGVDAVDRQRDSLWFMAQAVCGPVAFAADYANQVLTKPLPVGSELQRLVDEGDADTLWKLDAVSLGHVNEMGTLFCALAGLMNLAAILDALHFIPRPETRACGIGAATAPSRQRHPRHWRRLHPHRPHPHPLLHQHHQRDAGCIMTLADSIPFITPLNVFHVWWWLLVVPLAFGIAVIYKAMRLWSMERYWRAVAGMTVQIVVTMVALAAFLTFIVQWVIPATGR